MTLEFRTSFTRDLGRVRDRSLLKRVKETIEEVEAAVGVLDIKNLKKLRTEGRYYRVRLGDYRIGLIIEEILSFLSDFCTEAKSIAIFHKLQNLISGKCRMSRTPRVS